MKKEKTVKTYQRRTKSGKIVTVRQHTSKYDAAERAKDSSKRKGAGEELEKVKTKKALQKADLFDGYDFSEEDFNEWYEGTGSANDKKVAKALRKTLGRKAYDELSDLAADNYKKGGASSFFKKNVHSKTAETKTSNRTKKSGSKDSDLVEHYDQFNKKSMGKAVGDSFTFSEGRGKDKFTYDARFVTDGKGRYGYVVRDKEEGPDAKYYVGISDGYERHSQLPAGLRKAAEAQGLRFKNGEFVKKETKGDRAVARMNKLVNEALSSTTSDPKALKKQLGALIDYNGGPLNYGDKIGKRIDEIREQLRSSSKNTPKGKSSTKTEKENDYTIVKGPGMMGGEFAVKDGKAYTRDVTKKNPKWKPMKEWSSTAQKVLEYYEELQDTSMPKLKRKTSTKTSSAKEEYKAYKKLMDEKQKTGKRLSITETTKLKKLAKDAGVGRFIE